MKSKSQVDIFGVAVKEYYKSKWKSRRIRVLSDISGEEFIKTSYLFREFSSMPTIEQKALNLADGDILDIGACTGCHALELQDMGKKVTALEISQGCCDVMKERGVSNIICDDYFNYDGKHDTLLLLMNGIGLVGTIKGLRKFLQHSRSILNPNGTIYFDSSDIEYAYYEKDGSKWINLNSEYYGEVKYRMFYKKLEGDEFEWLFIDPDTMKQVAEEEGFEFTLLEKGRHYDYLGKLKIKT